MLPDQGHHLEPLSHRLGTWPIVPDGHIHRFYIKGDRPGTKNGWYIFFDYPYLSGAHGSWKTGEKYTWYSTKPNRIPPEERYLLKIQRERIHRQYHQEVISKQSAAALKAQHIWDIAHPVSMTHPYLVRKQVRAHGIRQNRGSLVIPLYDVSGAIYSLQFIDGNGHKRFLFGGRMKGCFFMIGSPGPVVCIAEGYATAASIHEVTGYPVAVSFNCGNLKSTALALQKRYPKCSLIICGDNDACTSGNPGATKALEAAEACGGYCIIPTRPGDFNDLMTGGI